MCQYTGPKPLGEAPPWMEAEYELCFRDVRQATQNMLASPDFKNEFDVAPYRESDERGERRYSNVMSGNWAWEQAVRGTFLRRRVGTDCFILLGSYC